jgi:hypothetical protein
MGPDRLISVDVIDIQLCSCSQTRDARGAVAVADASRSLPRELCWQQGTTWHQANTKRVRTIQKDLLAVGNMFEVNLRSIVNIVTDYLGAIYLLNSHTRWLPVRRYAAWCAKHRGHGFHCGFASGSPEVWRG